MSIEQLHQYVTQQASIRPDATAVVMRSERLTYQDLEVKSDKLAGLLSRAGCRSGDRVALLLPKVPQTLICMLAVMKCGGIYVPLDINNPAERVSKMIMRSAPKIIMANYQSEQLLRNIMTHLTGNFVPVLGWMEDTHPDISGITTGFIRPDIQTIEFGDYKGNSDPHSVAHILFTSGSTGMPKGVMVTHANVVSFVDWATSYFNISAEDRVSGHAPLHFDLSTFDIYGAFASGAELYMVPPDIGIIPNKIAEFMKESKLTQWFSVPSLLSYMARFDAVHFDSMPYMKRLLWCGEVFPTSALRYWMKRLPHVEFTNLYGPTETTIASSYYTMPAIPKDDDEEVPIGQPCAGEELLILDDNLKPVPKGEIGNLYIKGVGLTAGYWQDQEKTDEVFLKLSDGTLIYKTGDLARTGSDGMVYYHGREDYQVKTRGYRVELGEIENGLLRIPGIKECAVVPFQAHGMDAKAIGAILVMDEESRNPDLIQMRKDLSEFVPNYAIPAKWLELDEMPRNGNGKIDRKSLISQIENHVSAPHT